MNTFSFSASRVLVEHPLTLAAQGELVISEFVTVHNCACSIGLGTFQLRCKYAGANSFSASKQALNLSNNLRHLNINGRSIDDVLGIQTRGRRMVGPDKSTKLLRPQNFFYGIWVTVI